MLNIEIIFENEDILVLNKPAGLLIHPTTYQEKDTLVDWLLEKYPQIKDVGDDPLRPGVVHRLDKDTSGLLIVAKNQKAFEYFKKQFQERKIEKKYLALVVGRPKEDKGLIVKSITRSKRNPRKRTVLLDQNAKSAKTEYQVLKTYQIEKNIYSLLEVQIHTGRTHQIRVHLSSFGYPVAGDKEYKHKRQPCPENLNRQFLHAYHLKFYLFNGKMIKLKSNLPADLKQIIQKYE